MKKLLIPIVTFALLLVSCSDNLTDMNQDPKRPNQVPAENLFSNAQVSLGTYLNSSNINSNIFKLMAQYWASTTYATESQYELTTRSIPSNLWSELYRDVLFDLDDAATKINNNDLLSEGEKQNKIAMIEVLKVLTYSELVNIFGNIPYSEALDPDNTQPKYDDAATIYGDLMSRLNTAIGQFDPSAKSFGSATDIYYNGDVSAWIKFANSLKLRLAITLADVDNATAQTAIEEAAPNAFTSNADNATIPFQSAPPHTNPLWEDLVQSGRHDYVPANTIVDLMNSLDDPRRPVHFTLGPDDTYKGGIYGTSNTYPDFSHFGQTLKQPDFEGMIIEYAEVEFILAEAAERGYNVSGTALTHYNAAIRADMEYWGVPESEINAYLAQTEVAYATASGDYREKIGKQKYLGLWLQGLQAWTEWRRLDAPTFNPPPVRNMTEEDIPTRFTYPVDEQNLNTTNYEQAAQEIGGDELTTKLFWDTQ